MTYQLMSQNRINLLGADGLAFPAPNKKSFLPRSCCRDTQNREVNTFCWLPLVPTCLELKLFASHLEPILAEECCICKLKQCARTGQVAFIYYYLSLSHAAIPMASILSERIVEGVFLTEVRNHQRFK